MARELDELLAYFRSVKADWNHHLSPGGAVVSVRRYNPDLDS